MKTEIIRLDKNKVDMDKLKFAADVLKGGGLVAFPTETVYGLGANALDEASVKKIFEAKGRPSDNPLIVHIAHKNNLRNIAENFSEKASILMDKFWPGPLTLVMKKTSNVPDIITAGLDTVAVRIPFHPIALALISESGLPIAAPSANTSGKPSPTNAKHVIEDLSGKVDVIIDAGNSKVGLESTVLDVTVDPPMILRPGGVTPSDIEAALGSVSIDPAIEANQSKKGTPRSPGMKYTHYSPKAQVIVVEGKLDCMVEKIRQLANEYTSSGMLTGVLASDQTAQLYSPAPVISMGDRNNPQTIAANLFKSLREFDERGVQIILAESVGYSGIGLAIMNRMVKAAGGNIIKA